MSAEAWDLFVASGAEVSEALDSGVTRAVVDALGTAEVRDQLGALAGHARRIAIASRLAGAEDLGGLAEACERCLELVIQGEIPVELGLPILASSTLTLRQSFAALRRPGARPDARALAGARYELETLFPVPGARARPSLQAPDVPVGALVRKRPAS